MVMVERVPVSMKINSTPPSMAPDTRILVEWMDELSGKRLLILGLARQGKALARFAAAAGAQVVISDLRPAAELAADVRELADCARFVLGDHPLGLLDETDVLAISGAVPADAPFVQAARARGIPVTNDSYEFIKRAPGSVVGITGSAGKTTTTALTGAMGEASGRTTWIGGNIGQPLIAALPKMKAGDLVVQELSSFQLELWQRSPRVAAVLNVTPNHLDRHKTMAAYAGAKANILRYQTSEDIAILCADDRGSMALRDSVRGRLRLFSRVEPVADGAFVHRGQVWLRDGARETAVCDVAEIQLRGAHNLSNVLAAVTLADSAAVPADALRAAIRQFKGVAHRLELVAEQDGVRYVNDSIATAPERALAALSAYDEPLILLAGGRDKGMIWDEWARQVRQRVRYVILFGELGPVLEQHLTAGQTATDLRVTRVDTLAEAVQVARRVAVSGDVVLLSPGGTSYDAFADFAERGELFRRLVSGR